MKGSYCGCSCVVVAAAMSVTHSIKFVAVVVTTDQTIERDGCLLVLVLLLLLPLLLPSLLLLLHVLARTMLFESQAVDCWAKYGNPKNEDRQNLVSF